MKRIVIFLAVLVLAMSSLPAAGAAKGAKTFSYDFDFRFHLEPQDYPYDVREHMRGYEELVDALELKGNASWCPAKKALDFRVSLIPVSNPDAAISVRVFGHPNRLCIETPLLGPEPYFIAKRYRIMHFFRQLWGYTGLPLLPFFLVNPKTTESLLQREAATWTNTVPVLADGVRITTEQLEEMSETWKVQMAEDRNFLLWMDAIYSLAPSKEPIEEQLETLSDILTESADGEDLVITEDADGTLRCVNAKNKTVFTVKTDGDGTSFSLTPQNTMAEYRPEFSFSTKKENGTLSLKTQGCWDMTEPDPESWGDVSLLSFKVNAEGIPQTWPADGELTAEISTGGFLFPEIDWKVQLTMNGDGEVGLKVSEPDTKGKEGKLLLSGTGSVKPVEYEGTLSFTRKELASHMFILITNHTFISEKLPMLVPYFAQGIIDFLYELPVRACQSVMDDLDSFGILIHMAEALHR